MNDSALKSFCTWARTELIKGVEAQMVRYGITEPAPAPVGSETVSGLPLSPAEIEQRDELLRMQAEVGHEALRDRAAYTWFNRIVAIRFMDARGWLPSRMRMLSQPWQRGRGERTGRGDSDGRYRSHSRAQDGGLG